MDTVAIIGASLLSKVTWPEYTVADSTTPECFSLLRFFVAMFLNRKLLYADLPPKVEKRVMHDVSKAERRGIRIEQLFVGDMSTSDKLREILESTPKRQGREINYQQYGYKAKTWTDIRTNPWHIADYGIFMCPQHRVELYAATKDTQTVGLMEIAIIGGNVLVMTACGHADHRKDGTMNAMFWHVMHKHSDRSRFFYGNSKLLGTPMELFLRGLGITHELGIKWRDGRPLVS